MKKVYFLALLFVLVLSVPFVYSQCGSSCGDEQAKTSCSGGICSPDDCASCVSNEPAPTKTVEAVQVKIGTLTTPALQSMLNAKTPLILLDARSGKFDDGTRIPSAKSLNSESKVLEVLKMVPDKESLVVTYCSNLKCPASDKLAKHLKSLGYKNVVEYPEGIQGWKEAGNSVEKAK